jgi:hypothetical protein
MHACDEAFWEKETDEAAHGHGGHWHAFVEDVGEFFATQLPMALQQGHVVGRLPAQAMAAAPPCGVYIAHAMGAASFVSLIEIGGQGNHFISGWPQMPDAGVHRLVLRAGHIWENGLEAQLEAEWGPSCITFFDSLFLSNSAAYQKELVANFHLAVIAYVIETPDPAPIVLTEPERIRMMFPDHEPGKPLEIHTTGMAAFFQHEHNDRDDCEFRGPVKAVRELLGGAFGARAWVLRVTVLRDGDRDDEDIDLDIVVSERVLGEQSLPQVGDDVQGVGWVQGWLARSDHLH